MVEIFVSIKSKVVKFVTLITYDEKIFNQIKKQFKPKTVKDVKLVDGLYCCDYDLEKNEISKLVFDRPFLKK